MLYYPDHEEIDHYHASVCPPRTYLNSAGLDIDVWIGILVRVVVERWRGCELGDDGVLHAPVQVARRGTDAKASSLHPQLEFGGLVIDVISTEDLEDALVFIACYCLGFG